MKKKALPDLDRWLGEALSNEELHDQVHTEAVAWYKKHIEELYALYHTGAMQWLVRTAQEDGPMAAIPQDIRMTCYCIGAETWERFSNKSLSKGMTPEQDYLLSLFRVLIMTGWQLHADFEAGTFRTDKHSSNEG